MESRYIVTMVTVSGSFYDLVFCGSFEDVYRSAKRSRYSRFDKIYEIKVV